MSAQADYLRSPQPSVAKQPAPGGSTQGGLAEPPVRPSLRVLTGGRPAVRGISGRAVFALAAAVLFVSALAVVSTQAVLAQGQFRLEKLKIAEVAAQAREQRLTLEVANLKAPQRVVSTAEQKLGMVVPSHVTYLSSNQAAPPQK